MATVEFELFADDARNPGFGFTAQFTADGKAVKQYWLTAAQAHFLLGRIAREAEDLVNGEAGR